MSAAEQGWVHGTIEAERAIAQGWSAPAAEFMAQRQKVMDLGAHWETYCARYSAAVAAAYERV